MFTSTLVAASSSECKTNELAYLENLSKRSGLEDKWKTQALRIAAKIA